MALVLSHSTTNPIPEVYLASDQPTTCPKCGNRTDIITETKKFQIHKCKTENCEFQFTVEFDTTQGK